MGRRAKPFRADDKHRRSRVDVVSGGAAEAGHERAGVSPGEGTEFAGENDELSLERLTTRRVRQR